MGTDKKSRQEYQRRYYQEHKEKAKEYQRLYNLEHKKKRGGRGKANFIAPREARKMAFNAHDLMAAHDDRAVWMLDQILSRERLFTM